MKVIIAGSRRIDSDPTSAERVARVKGHICGGMAALGCTPPSAVLCGCADGVDNIGRCWAQHDNHVPVEFHQPDWKAHGRAAGPIRNRAMAEAADALILIWDGRSRGSANMRAEARRRGLPIYEVVICDGTTTIRAPELHIPARQE